MRALAIACVLACRQPPPASIVTPPPAPAANRVLVLEAPKQACADPPVLPPLIVEDTGALHTSVTTSGLVAFDSDGASAGRLLEQLARDAHRSAVIRGRGASVRIYAHVAGMPFDHALRAI